jgi:hypothetical protein
VLGRRLGVDFGTSNTVAVLSWPDGRAQPLVFDGSPMLPSAVFLGADGTALTGRPAQRSARSDPARYEPNPKRCIDDGSVLLGDAEVPVVDLIAVVLRRVADEAVRVGGGPPEHTVLTHPIGWGPRRRELLVAAATRVGLHDVALLPEPLAAAAFFTGVLAQPVPNGFAVVVYDFGGGTFDVSVVQRESDDGWRVLAGDGLDDVGGVDLDHVVVSQVAAGYAGTDPAGWRRLSEPVTPAERRYRRMLLDDAREAKEQLSTAPTAPIHVPLLDAETFVTREEFEAAARPWLDRTVSLTAATLSTAGVPANRIAGLFLVGGASRMPLVATLLHRRLGVAPTVIEQPELVVAQGSLHATTFTMARPPSESSAPESSAPGSSAPGSSAPDLAPPPETVVDRPRTTAPPETVVDRPRTTAPPETVVDRPRTTTPPRHRTGRVVPIVLSAVAALIVVLLVVSLVNMAGDGSPEGLGNSPSSGASPSCSQPDTFLERAGNNDMFCSASLKQFAAPWLGTTHCSVPSHAGWISEIVSCDARDWTVTFSTCASGKHNCPEGRQYVQADGAKVASVTSYTVGQGISGTKIVGSRSGVPFVYWDSDTSPASAELVSKVFNDIPAVKDADLQGVWQRYTA